MSSSSHCVKQWITHGCLWGQMLLSCFILTPLRWAFHMKRREDIRCSQCYYGACPSLRVADTCSLGLQAQREVTLGWFPCWLMCLRVPATLYPFRFAGLKEGAFHMLHHCLCRAEIQWRQWFSALCVSAWRPTWHWQRFLSVLLMVFSSWGFPSCVARTFCWLRVWFGKRPQRCGLWSSLQASYVCGWPFHWACRVCTRGSFPEKRSGN